MVDVNVGVDADEAAEGQLGDGAATATAKISVCREDELFWLDATVIDQLPKDIPNPEPAPVDEDALQAVRATFVAGLEASQEHTGMLARVASAVTGRRPQIEPVSPETLPPLPPLAPGAARSGAGARRRTGAGTTHRGPRRATSRVIGWLEHWWAGAPGTAFSDFAGLAGLLLTALALLWAWWHTRAA